MTFKLVAFLLCTGATISCARGPTPRREPACPPALAQTRFVEDSATGGTIAGTVLDRDSARPLGAALVQVKPTDQSTMSDSAGAFSIAGLPAGRYVISVRRIGYEQSADTLLIPAHRGVRSLIALTPAYVDRCTRMAQVQSSSSNALDRDAVQAKPLELSTDLVTRGAEHVHQ